jgi:serine/threonine protein kinase
MLINYGSKYCEDKGFNPEKADVFSLGILLFILFFGLNPFQSNTPADPGFLLLSSGSESIAEEYFSKQPLTARCNALGLIPKSLKSLLVKMLNASPELRPSLEDILGSDEWVTSPENVIPVLKYQQMMFYIKMVIDGKDPQKLFPESKSQA